VSDVTTASEPAPAHSAISGDGTVGDGIVVTVDTATVTLKIAPGRCVSAYGAVLNRKCCTNDNSAARPARVTRVVGSVATNGAAGNGQHACIAIGDATAGVKPQVPLNRPSNNGHGAGVGNAASESNSVTALTKQSIVIVNVDLIERHRSGVMDATPYNVRAGTTHNDVSGDRAMSDRQR
jgi:hypothetical protein